MSLTVTASANPPTSIMPEESDEKQLNEQAVSFDIPFIPSANTLPDDVVATIQKATAFYGRHQATLRGQHSPSDQEMIHLGKPIIKHILDELSKGFAYKKSTSQTRTFSIWVSSYKFIAEFHSSRLRCLYEVCIVREGSIEELTQQFQLGHGIYGSASNAYNLLTGKFDALKCFITKSPPLKGETAVERMMREYNVLCQLNRRIQSCYFQELPTMYVTSCRFFESHPAFLIGPLYNGINLLQWLHTAPSSEERIACMFLLVKAVNDLYQSDMYHYDIGLANVLIETIEKMRIRVHDWGLGGDRRFPNWKRGTFIHPNHSDTDEQTEFNLKQLLKNFAELPQPTAAQINERTHALKHLGEVFWREDLFAMFILFCFVLTNKNPFPNSNKESCIDSCHQVSMDWFKTLRYSERLIAFIEKGLQHPPEKRWTNVDAMFKEFHEIISTKDGPFKGWDSTKLGEITEL